MEEKINYRTIGIMTTVCLLLLGYVVWIPVQSEGPAYVGAFITEKSAVQQIAKISIRTPDGRFIQYVKTSGHWRIQKPYSAAVSESMIRELLEAVEKTRIMDIVEKQPETLSRYGLDEGNRIDVAFEFTDGTSQIFHIGERLPLNQIYVYFQRQSDPAVFRVWEGIRFTLEKHAATLMQGKPVRFNPTSIGLLEVEHEGRSLYMQKRAGNWFMISPVKRAVDPLAVGSYLESILDLTVNGAYPAGKEALEKLEGSGHYKITLIESEGREPIILRLAPEDAFSPALLSIEQDRLNAVYSTVPRSLSMVAFEPADFYLGHALTFDVEAIEEIELLLPQFAFKAERNRDGVWRLYQASAGQPADADMIGQLLHLLRNMTVENYVQDVHSISSTESPMSVKLSSSKGSISLKIVKDSGGEYRGSSENHPFWYRLNPAEVKRLEEFVPGTLVDRHLLAFDPRSVEKVVVQRGGDEYVLIKKGTAWSWEKSQKKKAGSGMAWKLVFGLHDLQYQQQDAEKRETEKVQNSCGIENPDIVIQLEFNTEPEAEMLMKETENGNELIVFTSRLPGCYRVEKALVDHFLPDSAVFD